MTIVLIGMMTCGKSTMGRKLAHETGFEFIDQDELVENKITTNNIENAIWSDEIFKSIQDIQHKNKTIISSGGEFGTMNGLKEKFDLVIFLDASLELITQRILHERKNNPSAKHNAERKLVSANDNENDIENTSNIKEVYDFRKPLYIQNSHTTFEYSSNDEQERTYLLLLQHIIEKTICFNNNP